MKNINKYFIVAALSMSLGMTSCIEETEPTSSITEEQLASSSKAAEAFVWAMPAFMNKLGVYSSSNAYDWGYGSIMHIRDVLTADQAVTSSGYNWYSRWASNTAQGPRYVYSYFSWAYFYRAIQTANLAITGLKGTDVPLNMGYLGASYAYRALFYLDVAREYEFLPNDIFSDGYNAENNYIMYLTTPIVTEDTPEEMLENNPRVSHEEMYAFIESDLDKADSLITAYSRPSKSLPDKACVDGLRARLYMWNASYMEEAKDSTGNRLYTDEQALAEYAKAEVAAHAAITEGNNVPLTQAEWTDTKNGFNNMSVKSWMWGATANEDNDAVQSGILNWTSWMSNEATFGYAAAGPYVMIASELYDKMSNTDFRKLSFKAPKKTALQGQEPLVVSDPESKTYMYGTLPDYSSFKFRPGGGEASDYKIGAACDYPLMRVEEMYLIEAEAAAHQNAARGASLLEKFVQTYRDRKYICTKSTVATVVDEIFQQKRIELWGEGRIFFDYKRLNKSVDRTKSGNFDGSERFKTEGRPAWMNFCITINEENGNKALTGYNNPDYSSRYKAQ